MRHNSDVSRFGRKSGPRKALLRGLVDSLVEHGRIRTTLAKAKELRGHVERAITIGKRGDFSAMRVLLSRYPNEKTVNTIVKDLAPRFKTRPGGYTRVIKLGERPGDRASMALIEFVDYQGAAPASKKEAKGEAAEAKKGAKKKKAAGAKGANEAQTAKAEAVATPKAMPGKSANMQQKRRTQRKSQGQARRVARGG